MVIWHVDYYLNCRNSIAYTSIVVHNKNAFLCLKYNLLSGRKNAQVDVCINEHLPLYAKSKLNTNI